MIFRELPRFKGMELRSVEAAKPCLICGAHFQVTYHRVNVAKYCSRKCYYKSLKGKGSVEIQCRTCRKGFLTSPSRTHGKKFCSRRCYAVWDNSRSSNSAYPNNIRRKLKRAGRMDSCSMCGYSAHPEILEVHHVDHNRRNNHWENLAVICPNCHKLHHFGS